MKQVLYQIDAFTSQVFAGNPAAVCPLKEWIPDKTMQAIAAENNLSETAFFVKNGDIYELRWFTPAKEVDLCGHATLASAFVIFNELNSESEEIVFSTRSGELKVTKAGELLVMDFPAYQPKPCEIPENLVEGLGKVPKQVLSSIDYLVEYDSQEDVANLTPDFEKLKQIDLRGVIVTAKGDKADFVSRVFAPQYGINEDPVTGSAHSTLIPFWSKKLNKSNLYAQQISKRGGELFCEMKGDRVVISGKAIKYLEGTIYI